MFAFVLWIVVFNDVRIKLLVNGKDIDLYVLTVSKDCFMASTDLKDAFFVIPLASKHRRFLRFFWEGKLTNSAAFLSIYHLLRKYLIS